MPECTDTVAVPLGTVYSRTDGASPSVSVSETPPSAPLHIRSEGRSDTLNASVPSTVSQHGQGDLSSLTEQEDIIRSAGRSHSAE